MIRNAKMTDILELTMFLQDCHARSRYAGTGVEVDPDACKGLLMDAIQRHGKPKLGGCFVQVAERDGRIVGLILATLVRVYSIGNKLTVSDLFWVTNKNAHPGDAVVLMRNMTAWAESSPDIHDGVSATTYAIMDDPKAAGRILEYFGYEPYGTLYRRDFHQQKTEVAA